jgi:hypothetical protein
MKALRALGDLLHGMGTGAFVVIVIAMILIVLANIAVADETVAVRPARLGEQDRSLNYPLDPYLAIQGDDVDMLLADPPTGDELLTEEMYYDCLDSNKSKAYSREYILKAIERAAPIYDATPVYKDTLEMLVPTDCEEILDDD